MSEPRPASATHLKVDEYDARFAVVRDRLVRVCVGFVGADDAEDVVHEAFVRGRARYRQLRDDDLFEAWITRIAINLCLDAHGARRRLLRLFASRPRQEREAEPRDIGLRQLIEQLPPRERTLVVLHYGYGFQLQEIATMTGLSAVNVRTILFRARRRLRDRIEDAR